jgi:hypothetical protein
VTTLVNANGSTIPSWNFVKKQLKFGNHCFTHSFLQAKVAQPILGVDFLSRHSLAIDCNSSRVLYFLITSEVKSMQKFLGMLNFYRRFCLALPVSLNHSLMPLLAQETALDVRNATFF